jgi:hypothetical protein
MMRPAPASALRGLCAAALIAALAPAAQAATLSWGALPAVPQANPIATATSGIVSENVTDSVGGVRLSPWDYTPPVTQDGNPFTSVGCDNSNGACTAWALYEFERTMKSLSFVWGSPDGYNTVEFLLRGTVVDSVSGQEPVDAFGSGGNLALPTVTISDIAGGQFDAVRFVSGAPAFEYAQVRVAAVPVPAAGLLLAGALGGLAALRRRKAA